jgi:hypothetical protein
VITAACVWLAKTSLSPPCSALIHSGSPMACLSSLEENIVENLRIFASSCTRPASVTKRAAAPPRTDAMILG